MIVSAPDRVGAASLIQVFFHLHKYNNLKKE